MKEGEVDLVRSHQLGPSIGGDMSDIKIRKNIYIYK
jgi:hypothetical protein